MAINPQRKIVTKAYKLFSVEISKLGKNDSEVAKIFYEKAKQYPSTTAQSDLQ
jgi:hypothetical protein